MINEGASPLSGLRVMVAEDEPLLSMVLVETIMDHGCVVVGTAQSVEEALELATASAFDVAVLDVNLRGHTVDKVASVVVGRGKAVVFSSGYGASGIPEAFRSFPILTKPYEDATLLAALTTAAARRLPAGSVTPD